MEIDTAFVLPGGGSLGAVQVGMLQALLEEKLYPELLIGSSAGAINAAYIAAHADAFGIERLSEIWRSLRNREVFAVTPLGSTLSLLGLRSHLCDPDHLRKLLSKNLPFDRIEESPIPLRIAATDIMSGEHIHFAQGELVPAILASAAIPAVFPPVQIGERFFVDGSIANHVPVAPAVEEFAARRVIVLPTGFTCARTAPPTSAIDMALHSLYILLGGQLQTMMKLYGHRSEILIIPPLCPLHTKMHDFSQAPTLIKDSYQNTRQWLQSGGLDPQSEANRLARSHAGVPPELLPHRH